MPTEVPLPAPLVPMDEVALVDENAVAHGCVIKELMERAGTALAETVTAQHPNGPILVACGPGNNGGDGYVCARLLAEGGRQVVLWPVIEAKSPLCREQATQLPPAVQRISALSELSEPPVCIVDAMLGAGSSGAPRGAIADALAALAQLKRPCIAADLPTGLGSQAMLPATLTVCFQLAKQELLDDPAVGEFKTVDIGIPAAAYQDVHSNCLRRFPHHGRTQHKGQHGELLVIGGSQFPGACSLSSQAGLRSGCDLVRAWTLSHTPLPASIIRHDQPGKQLGPANTANLTPLLARAGAVLLGPGLGLHERSRELVQQIYGLICEMDIPLVIDADAIVMLAQELSHHPADAPPVIITPHHGEAQKLLNAAATHHQLHAFARPNRVLLAKGVSDFITDGRQWQYNRNGNARLAQGGTGDCLAGLSAGLIARGARPFDAVRMAVYWLCDAGDRLWLDKGPCYTPEELLDELAPALHTRLRDLDLWPPLDD